LRWYWDHELYAKEEALRAAVSDLLDVVERLDRSLNPETNTKIRPDFTAAGKIAARAAEVAQVAAGLKVLTDIGGPITVAMPYWD
jgi:hypothetical protein